MAKKTKSEIGSEFNGALGGKPKSKGNDNKAKPGGKKFRIKTEDQSSLAILGAYLVQKMGKPTLHEMINVIRDKLNGIVPERGFSRALDGLCKGSFITKQLTQNDKGIAQTTYTVRTLSWKAPPEYMQLRDLLPVLTSTNEAVLIKTWFDSQEGQGAKKSSNDSKGVWEYHWLRWYIVTTDLLLGSQPGQGEVHKNVRAAFKGRIEKENIQVTNFFDRHLLTGEYLIAQDVLNGWFKTNCTKYADQVPWLSDEIAFKPIRFTPDKPVLQAVFPVVNNKNASGPTEYEVIQPGQALVLEMLAPVKGTALSVEQYEQFVLISGIRPKRGISPARGRRFGRFLVTKFEDLGTVDGSSVQFLADDIPQDILEAHGDYFREACDRMKVKLANKRSEPAEAGAFPL